MANPHESGLPHAYDRAAGKPEQQSVVFYGDRPFLQSAELNELQTIARGRHNRLGRLVAKDGDRIERADAFVDVTAGTVTLTSGSIFVAGDVFPVADAVLTGVAMTGRTEIGVRLAKSWLTHEQDPDLLGPVPGSLAEGERGAAREIVTIAWAHASDGGSGSFFSVYTLQDGVILDQTGPSILEPAMQAIAVYDRVHGHYVVSGCTVTALGAQAGAQVFSIEQGEANISGFKRTRYVALRHAEPQAWDEVAIPGETHTYPGGASHTVNVDQFPIGVINSILLTKEKTVTITRGAIAHGADGLPDTSVVQLVSVVKGGTTYNQGGDYIRTGNTVDWAPAGAEPAAGETYQVTYRYRASVSATAQTDRTVTVSGGATGGDIIIAYTQKMARVDVLGLNVEGSPVYIKGVSARSNPIAPIVPSDVLALATITNDWMNKPAVVNDGVRSVPYSEIWRYFNRIVDHDRLIQLERLKSGIDSREPVAKKGMFVDPFTDDSYRDSGVTQTAAIGRSMLQLAIVPTFHYATLAGPVMLDYVEEVIITQGLKTACEKINPYANFTPLPASLALNPAVDFWTESQTQWLSAQTVNVNMGTTVNGPLQTTSVSEDVVDRRSEQAEFLRPITVQFEIKGFGAGEQLQSLTFDDVNVKPPGTQTADGTGKITGSFAIPANVTAGTKIVVAKGVASKEAVAMFTGAGTIEIDIMRRVTTVNNWTREQVVDPRPATRPTPFRPRENEDRGRSDPQAQVFMPSTARQVVGVDFHICHVGDQSKGLLVEQVTTDNGYPSLDIVAQSAVSMAGVGTGWKSARYALPVTTLPDRLSAFVIKTDDNMHSVSLAKLGGFDPEIQKYVSAHPYVTGPRFSSVNAETWTAHQDEALSFRVVAAKYTATTKTVSLGSINLVNCSDIQIRAAVELPSAACSVLFEIERTNGTIYRLLPFQLLQLTEFLTETVQLRAILKGTEQLSPTLFAPVEIIAGQILTEATYVTRAFTLGTNVRITSYLKSFLPGGAALTVQYSIDGGAWQSLPLASTEALSFPLWTERKYQASPVSGGQVRLKITATGGPSARLIAGDFGAGVF
ncbi:MULTISPECIES: DUF4815 domain-containing protein [unclassified Ensifer]|uniref:DUF4815 domain-containing protein n=1 Tax=unclassified Ensifer TaxID=2633371 RepID=UPI0008138A7A|nr:MULTISPECIES: DUF4815 domain-containing protein [unclassified Ensifer]OCP17431.1 DUF4815 domain-containing protein [Ensifer sp. LC54]OCP28663.1 DUF4815 domain-containing protein [Ensifer sp. LC384]